MNQRSIDMKYPSAIRKRVEGDWNCSKCENLNFSFRNKCNKCQNQRELQNAFDCALYIFPPSLNEEPFEEEEVSHHVIFGMAQLPSISPFLKDKFMKTPSSISPLTSRLLNFEKENSEITTIVTGNVKHSAQKKDLDDLLSKVKKPNTQREGDWLCLKCHNLNFAFRKECNICTNTKTEYIPFKSNN
jgi:Zn-finger in Ran binding protein and others